MKSVVTWDVDGDLSIAMIQMLLSKQSTKIVWWRLAVSSRDVAIYISSDYIVRQTIKQFI